MRLNTTMRQVLADIQANRRPSDMTVIGSLRKKGYVVCRPDGSYEVTYAGINALTAKPKTGKVR